MYKDKKVLALIAARGASRGLPRKNIKPLSEKPLIAWTIEQARDSKCIDRVIVSTDDETIAKVSKEHRAEVPFTRPAELAADDSPVCEAILHALDFLEEKNQTYDILVSLECTSPMRYKNDIDNAIKKLVDNRGAGSVVGVVEATNDHPLWTFKVEDGYLTRFVPQQSFAKNFNRQQLEKVYLPYSIYVTWWEDFKKYRTFYQPNTLLYLLKREQKVDIDDEVDFYMAECFLERYLKKDL